MPQKHRMGERSGTPALSRFVVPLARSRRASEAWLNQSRETPGSTPLFGQQCHRRLRPVHGSPAESRQAFTDVFRRALFVVKTSWFIGLNSLRSGAADPPLPLRHVTSTDWRSKSALSQRLAFTPKS